MKTIYILLLTFTIISQKLLCHDHTVFAVKTSEFYNRLLDDQSAIDKVNSSRPKIYIYTDFGGGTNKGQALVDLQTSGEIASAAWKATLQQELYINDSAIPLSPIDAAFQLAKTFPYETTQGDYWKDIPIRKIVIHVVDPGVGNQSDKETPQPRSIALRKDGVVFIGPDNGSLSFVCPAGSIAGIWEINFNALHALSGIDTEAGGTFHGRDLFSEAAFRIAAGEVSLDEIGTPYTSLQIKNRHSTPELPLDKPLVFSRIQTAREVYNAHVNNSAELFEKAFLLGTIQSSLYKENSALALTKAKRLFIPDAKNLIATPLIAIVNLKSQNIFIGPNNGLGTSFFKDYLSEDFEVFTVSEQLLQVIWNESNNEAIYTLLQQQPVFSGRLEEVYLLGNEDALIRDDLGHPQLLRARIWVDLYGNIKTTIQSSLLDEAKGRGRTLIAILNGVAKPLAFAETFSEVANGQLFVYNGSTGVIGPNPHRSKRYVELTANGIFGKFGVDFFENNQRKPQSGDVIWILFA